MVQYWLLSYPPGNTSISIKENLIGGRNQSGYEKLFKYKLNIGDKLILYVHRQKIIKGIATITSPYIHDINPVWPVINGEIYPHRRHIRVDEIYPDGQEPSIHQFYDNLDKLKEARKENQNLGKTWGFFVRGITPKQINEHDYLLLSSSSREITIHPPANDKEILKQLRQERRTIKKETIITQKYKRSRTLVEKLKQLYNYQCQICNPNNPEIPLIPMKNGTNYVEVHHIEGFGETVNSLNPGELEDYSIDNHENTIVVCSHHHKLLHHHKNNYYFELNSKSFISQDGKYNIPIKVNKHL